jgi:NADH-quinone oxidoreductase subunit L
MYDTLIPAIAILPMIGFLFTAVFGRRLGKRAHLVPVSVIVIVWLISMVVVYAALTHQAPFNDEATGYGHGVLIYTWIPAGAFEVTAGFYVDALTACLLIVVTTIGMLVHIYSIGYMAHDAGYWRFFAYLNLFMFSMLLLVMADSFLVIFVAWELVGLSSYLLIGFWKHKRSAALASKKAFLVNRVGDVGFALGIMLVFVSLGTLNLHDFNGQEGVLARIGELDPAVIFAISLLIFAGAMGKSAQFPLHVWLPDAMEGPTPVSALIHAATMVNAGVYLVARTSPIFAHAESALVAVASIGIFTAILAASIAMTQTDIKRVLAYSTLSQLGYMFAALGVGAFSAAIFHLMTHGFFKGLLFLGSGSVIHAVHEEQDMRRMGGLAKKIPITYITMLIGALALAGIPPLAGFFSKDEILDEAWVFGFPLVWAIGVFVALLTAFYMFRLMGLTFWGQSRVDPAVEPKVHESPPVMTWPLIILAIPSIFLGLLLGLPLGASILKSWLEPIFEESELLLGHAHQFELFGIDGTLLVIGAGVAATGVALGWYFFGAEIGRIRVPARPQLVTAFSNRLAFLYRASLNKWWFDELNHLLFIVIGGYVANALWWFDRRVIDGTVNGLAAVTIGAGREIRQIQTGRVQNYALGIAIGLIVMAGSFLFLAGR